MTRLGVCIVRGGWEVRTAIPAKITSADSRYDR